MTSLLDVDFLIALAWPNHVHHSVARRWFSANYRAGWATCAFTQAGFIRVSANRAIVSEAAAPEAAIGLLARLIAVGHHSFWQSDVSFTELPDALTMLIAGHRQVTDGYLLALASRHDGRLVTLDPRLENLVPARGEFAPRLFVAR